MDSQGIYRGLDADICRAIGAAVFGDASKVRFIPRFLAARLPSLQSGQIDVWPAPPPGRRTARYGDGLNFTAVTFYDGLGFLVRRSAGVQHARDLEGATICATAGSTSELNLADGRAPTASASSRWFFESNEEAATPLSGRPAAMPIHRCLAARRHAHRAARTPPSTSSSRADLQGAAGAGVRHGDDQGFDIVRWTITP